MTTSTTLDPVAADLAAGILAGRHGPCIVGFRTLGGASDVWPLGDLHPLDVLWDLRPSGCWEAVVVATTGRVVAAEPPPDPPGRPPAERAEVGRPVVVAAATGRRGPDRSLVLGPDGRALLVSSEATGLVPDACRRAIGRSTPPPEVPVTAWWAADWLVEVAELVTGAARPWTLADLVARHPAVELEELPGDPAELVGFVVERGWDHAHLTGWDGVRRARAEGLVPDAACPPQLAGWFDAGSFSRYAQLHRPSPATVLELLRPLVPAEVAAGVRRILELWQLIPCR